MKALGDFIFFSLNEDTLGIYGQEEEKDDSSDILLWAKFINAEQKEEFDMLATKNPYIQSDYEQLQVISQNE